MTAVLGVNWSAPLSSLAGSVAIGSVLVDNGSGAFLVSTTANRGTKRSSGIAIAAGDASNPVPMVTAGDLPTSITGLAAGSASAIRVSSSGTLERVATPVDGDDVVGWVEASGLAHVVFGVLTHRVFVDSGGGGGGGSPGGSNGDLQYRVNSTTFGGITPATGLTTWFATPTSANLRTVMTDETGTGALVFATGPTLSAPVFSTISNTGTITLPTATTTLVGRDTTDTLTNKTISFTSNTVTFSSAEARTACSDETGTGALVFADTPSLITPKIADSAGGQFYNVAVSNLAADRTITLPLLGAADVFVFEAHTQTLTNKTINGSNNTISNVAIGSAVSGLGANVATMLGTFSSANIRSACTDETGSGGSLVFATSPTLTTPVVNGQILGATVAVAAMAIDWSLGQVFTKTLAAGANTFTFSNQASGMVITVRVTSNGGGSTLTWPTVRWAGGAAPTQTSTGTDVYTFVHDGSNIYGSVVQAMA